MEWALQSRKWVAVLSIWIQDALIYKANTMIWILTDVANATIMPLVWLAASQSAGGHIGSFSSQNIVLYYMVSLALTGPIVSHIVWDVALEIREGTFTAQLLRPMSLYQYTFFRSLAWRLMRPVLFFPFLALLVFMFRNLLHGAQLYLGFPLLVSVVCGHMLSFLLVMAMCPVALYTQEAFAIFELYYVPSIFLSGQMFPVSIMPSWASEMSHRLPFYFVTGVPSEIAVGVIHGSAVWKNIGYQFLWAVFFLLIGKLLWKRGLKHYNGIGL